MGKLSELKIFSPESLRYLPLLKVLMIIRNAPHNLNKGSLYIMRVDPVC